MSKKPVFRHAWSLLEEKRLPNMRMKFWLQGIRIQRLGANRVYPTHEHVQFEIHLMLSGGGESIRPNDASGEANSLSKTDYLNQGEESLVQKTECFMDHERPA